MSLPNVDTAGVWDLVAYQGDTRVWTFTMVDNAGSPVSLSGTTITMTIKRQRGANVPTVWEGSTTGGEITISGAGDNIVNVYLDGDYPAGSLVYDVEFVKSSQTITYLTGQFIVTTEVTA
jgi:hypothetical protein